MNCLVLIFVKCADYKCALHDIVLSDILQMKPFPVIGYGGMGMAKDGLEYTILVVTGWKGRRRNTANVHMRLFGTKDSSPVIPLDDGIRQVRVCIARWLDQYSHNNVLWLPWKKRCVWILCLQRNQFATSPSLIPVLRDVPWYHFRITISLLDCP